MKKILLTIQYNGKNFAGWQVQPNKRTIQGVLEEAISKLLQEKITLFASGRTDSGVHAVGQKVHFDTSATIPPKNFKSALNSVLSHDIRVTNSKRVDDEFNARYSAKEKTYIYSLYYGDENALKSRYKTHLKITPNIEVMKSACKVLEGTHDFKCFLASGSSVKDTVRTIYSIKIIKKGKDIDIKVSGNGFLYNMVRIIVGTLIGVSENRISLEDIKTALETGDRKKVGKTMPPQGLCLYSVSYSNKVQ